MNETSGGKRMNPRRKARSRRPHERDDSPEKARERARERRRERDLMYEQELEREEWLLESRRARQPKEPGEPPRLVRAANRWWDRLLDVADKRSFEAGASEYAANQTTRDYVLNTLGLGAWGALFPLLSSLNAVHNKGIVSLSTDDVHIAILS